VLLLLDYWPLLRLEPKGAGAFPDRLRLKRAVIEKLPLVAIAAAVGVVTVAVQSDAGAVLRGDLLSFRLRAMNALNSYVAYIASSFWPTNLSIFYPHPMGRASGWLAAAQAVGLTATTVWFMRTARTRPYLIVGWLWFVLALVPVIGLVQVGLQARADRYTYLTQIGLTIALAWGANDLLGRTRAGRRTLALLGVGTIIGLSIAASQQVAHWRSTLSLYEHAVAANDASPLAHLGLAGLMLQSDRIAEAETYYIRALEISPGMAGAHAGLADVLSLQGRFDLAIERYRRALRRFPRRARWRAHLGKALAEDGQTKAAIAELERAIDSYRNRGTPEVHAYLASALAQDRQLERARLQYLKAIALRPEYGDAHVNLGFVLVLQQRHQEALAHLERALELDGETAELRASLGETSAELGNPADAKLHYSAALRLRPGWLPPANNLAWILATHPDPRVCDAEQALRIAETLTRSHPTVLDTIAAAQAAAGQFDDARKNAIAAIALARNAGRDDFVRAIEARLALYRADQAFVESLPARD
ncbi:MAG: tetratricopeptide repeat protein, partial [Myxococcota bacterium]